MLERVPRAWEVAGACVRGVRNGREQPLRHGQLPRLCYGGEGSHRAEEAAPGVRLRKREGCLRHPEGPLEQGNLSRPFEKHRLEASIAGIVNEAFATYYLKGACAVARSWR